MSVWVVVGGQYGSEGKGKISAYITLQEGIDLCVRCGGPNSGHSFVTASGATKLVKQLPTGFVKTNTRLLLPAGAYIDLKILRAEIEELQLDPSRVGIDRNAVVITKEDREHEREKGLQERLSSTLSGVGAAAARRAMRDRVQTAGTVVGAEAWLKPFVTHVAGELNCAALSGKRVLIEGTQGFGLSVYHSPYYPKATSRDTTASGFLSECGLSPRLVSEIVLVLRTFPIRVAGVQAGPMRDEISWEVIQRESKYPRPISEYTTVTKRLRRIARFDWDLAREACVVNRPTRLAINGLDYLDYSNFRVKDTTHFSRQAGEFIDRLEARLSTPVTYCGTSPFLDDVLQRSGSAEVAQPLAETAKHCQALTENLSPYEVIR